MKPFAFVSLLFLLLISTTTGDENPYVFEEQDWSTVIKSEHGQVEVLHKFNHTLLQGINNFRLSVLVANPRAFFLPAHWDADAVIFVSQGTT